MTSDDTVLMAWELMRRGHFHHLPVVTEHGGLLGVLDTETIAARWNAGGPDSNREPIGALLQGRWSVTVKPDDTLATAAQVMLARHADAVAVTTAEAGTADIMEPGTEDRLVGLLTVHDLIAALAGTGHHHPPTGSTAPSLYRVEPVTPPGDPAAHERSVMPPD